MMTPEIEKQIRQSVKEAFGYSLNDLRILLEEIDRLRLEKAHQIKIGLDCIHERNAMKARINKAIEALANDDEAMISIPHGGLGHAE